MYSSRDDMPRRPAERPTSAGSGHYPSRGNSSSGRADYSGGQSRAAPHTDAGFAQASRSPVRTAPPPGGIRRRPVAKRFKRKSNGRPIVVALAAVLVAGLGVFGAIRLFSASDALPVGEMLPSDTQAVVPEAVSPAEPPAVFDVKVAACYSEDAFVVEHLQVPAGVSTHPMMAAVTDTASSYSTEPVEIGTSGKESIETWKATNSDTIGWLKIPGTKINYAVLQGPSTSYYTDLGYDKKYSKNGVIWAAGNCAFGEGASSDLSFNTVLYGHNWTNYGANPRVLGPNDEMFAQLTGYHHLWFAKSHPYIWFSTGSQEMLWQVFAVFYADTSFDYINPNGGQAMLDGMLARSEFNYDIPVSTSDKILTLSTCTQRFGPSRQQRFVVMAKLVDSASEEQPNVVVNPNPIRPSL